jgi:hypothetical protein
MENGAGFQEALRKRAEVKAKLIKAKSEVAECIAELADLEQQIFHDYTEFGVELLYW